MPSSEKPPWRENEIIITYETHLNKLFEDGKNKTFQIWSYWFLKSVLQLKVLILISKTCLLLRQSLLKIFKTILLWDDSVFRAASSFTIASLYKPVDKFLMMVLIKHKSKENILSENVNQNLEQAIRITKLRINQSHDSVPSLILSWAEVSCFTSFLTFL